MELRTHVASKTDAENIAADIRSQINAGTFRQTIGEISTPRAETVSPVMTLDSFVPIYIERAAKASGKATWKDDVSLLTVVRNHRTGDGRRLGAWALTAITEDELEAFHSAQRHAGRAINTLNHYVQVISRLSLGGSQRLSRALSDFG